MLSARVCSRGSRKIQVCEFSNGIYYSVIRVLCILIAVLLGINNVFIHYKIAGISYDRLLEIALFFLLFKGYLRELTESRFFRIFNLFLLIFFVLQIIVDFRLALSGSIDFEKLMRDCARFLTYAAFAYLFVFIAKRNIKYVNIVLFCHFLIFCFAVLQHPASPYASKMASIRSSLFAPLAVNEMEEHFAAEEEYIMLGMGEKFRVSGPFNNSIGLAYLLLSSFFISYYMFYRTRNKLYLINCMFIFFVSVLSQTRSLLLAELFFIVGVLAFSINPRVRMFSRGMFVVGLLLIALNTVLDNALIRTSAQPPSTRILKFNDEGSDRPQLWLTGLYAVGNHPVGITDREYMQAKLEMFSLLKSPSVLVVAAHNGFINIGFNYSIFGYAAFIAFGIFLVRKSGGIPYAAMIIFRLFFISYIINSFFHNNFIFDSDYDVLMVMMLLSIECGRAADYRVKSVPARRRLPAKMTA